MPPSHHDIGGELIVGDGLGIDAPGKAPRENGDQLRQAGDPGDAIAPVRPEEFHAEGKARPGGVAPRDRRAPARLARRSVKENQLNLFAMVSPAARQAR